MLNFFITIEETLREEITNNIFTFSKLLILVRSGNFTFLLAVYFLYSYICNINRIAPIVTLEIVE